MAEPVPPSAAPPPAQAPPERPSLAGGSSVVLDARAKRILDRALDLADGERMSHIDRSCNGDLELRARVVRLLELSASDGPFLSLPTLVNPGQAGALAGERPGARIGPYKLLELIGEGGFGSVFMAEQTEPMRRRVALKVIKLGMDTRAVVARFEQERQALALMDHPNIARVLDAGATDTGRPFFVMELVKGQPITEYCDQANLSIPERLDLFVQVCRAVQHAHSKGIIHRDIKPSNVLVVLQDGRPLCKIIDFGIAKATQQPLTDKTIFTEFRQLIGTPEYMSPEQATGSLDVDTRSDVYSLGVLLYELLAGVTPLDPARLRSAAFAEMQRMIREEEPPVPSTRLSRSHETLASLAALRQTEPRRLSSIIRGELDWIVMRALEKDRARRYESAGNLAADIERYRLGQPVLAAPPSAVYRAGKFVRRHRTGAVAAALVAAAMVVGLSVALWQFRVASRERDIARAAASEAVAARDATQRIAEFQASQLRSIDPAVMGHRMRLEILNRAREDMIQSGMQEPDAAAAAARLDTLLGYANFTDVALKTLDENIFSRALQAIDGRFADQPAVKASLLMTAATTMSEMGLYERAEGPMRESVALRRLTLGDDDRETIAGIGALGGLLSIRGIFGEAEVLQRESVERATRVLGREDPLTTESLNRLGLLMHARGRYEEADRCFREVLEIHRRVAGPDDLGAIRALSNIGLVLHTRGLQAEAEPYFREALERFRRIRGEDHPDTWRSASNLARVLAMNGHKDEAEVILRDILGRMTAARGEDHADTLSVKNSLAVVVNQLGREEEAERLYRQILEARVRLFGRSHPSTLDSLDNLGTLLADEGRFREAEPLLRQALAGLEKGGGNNALYAAITRMRLGVVLGKLGRFAEGEALLLDVQRLLGSAHGGGQTHSLSNLAELYDDWDKAEPGKGYDQKAAECRRNIAGTDDGTHR